MRNVTTPSPCAIGTARKAPPMQHEHPLATSLLLEAADAAAELREALALAGFALPSLRGDTPAGDQAHVRLGGASASAVRDLAAWIRARA